MTPLCVEQGIFTFKGYRLIILKLLPSNLCIEKNTWREEMVKRILQLSACLMIMVTLSAAQAQTTSQCTGSLMQRAECCKAGCKNPNNAFACCKQCIWGTINYNFSYYDKDDKAAMKACGGIE